MFATCIADGSLASRTDAGKPSMESRPDRPSPSERRTQLTATWAQGRPLGQDVVRNHDNPPGEQEVQGPRRTQSHRDSDDTEIPYSIFPTIFLFLERT